MPTPARPGATVLTDREAAELKEQTIDLILDLAIYADEGIYAIDAKHPKNVGIWSSIDREEATILAEAWIGRARTSPKTARRLRTSINYHRTRLKVAIIIVPRAIATIRLFIADGIGLL